MAYASRSPPAARPARFGAAAPSSPGLDDETPEEERHRERRAYLGRGDGGPSASAPSQVPPLFLPQLTKLFEASSTLLAYMTTNSRAAITGIGVWSEHVCGNSADVRSSPKPPPGRDRCQAPARRRDSSHERPAPPLVVTAVAARQG